MASPLSVLSHSLHILVYCPILVFIKKVAKELFIVENVFAGFISQKNMSILITIQLIGHRPEQTVPIPRYILQFESEKLQFLLKRLIVLHVFLGEFKCVSFGHFLLHFLKHFPLLSSLLSFLLLFQLYFFLFIFFVFPHYNQSFINLMNNQILKNFVNHKIENYRACMVLAAVGDAMGYKNGDWQFLTNGSILHQKMMELTQNKGPLALKISLQWRYSDDTVMHIATALALTNKQIKSKGKKNIKIEQICRNIAIQYKKCWQRMSGRAPGKTTGKSIMVLNADGSNWNKIPFNDRGCGCGASMRSACIGLAFYDDIQRLVAISIQSGRLTHHNPAAYLASLISSYFTGLAIQGIDPALWLAYFLVEAVPIAYSYIQKVGRQVKSNLQGENWKKFIASVQSYAKKRGLSMDVKEKKQPEFPQKYGVVERQHFYHEISWGKWPGALGIDSVLIAYDAFLSSKGSWQQLCLRAILHGGDNDSTGTIAGAWFGAYYGFKGVPSNHTDQLQDNLKLRYLGEQIFNL